MKKEQIPRYWVIGRQLSQDGRNSHMNCDIETGIRHTAFLSFYEDHRKSEINSAQSFHTWRSHALPLLEFENDFIEGWKILSDFRRSTSRQLFIIQEPRFNHQFEISTEKIIPMLKNIHIIDGVIQGKWALRRDRSLISETEFNKLNIRQPWQKVDTLDKFDVITMKGKQLIYMGKLKRVVFEYRFAARDRKVDLIIYETQSFIRFSDDIMSNTFAQSGTLPKVNFVRKLTEEERAKAQEYYSYYLLDGHHWIPGDQELVPRICVGAEENLCFAYGHFAVSRTGTLYFCIAELSQPRETTHFDLVRMKWNAEKICFDLDLEAHRVGTEESHRNSGIEPISIVFK
jgi:hypothetical protein